MVRGGGNPKSVIQQRIEPAKSEFQQQIDNFPDREIVVTASFTRSMPIGDVVERASLHQLSIVGFRHGSVSHSGGYTLAPGESLEDAIVQYQHDAVFFTDQDLRNTESLMMTVADEAVRRALQERRAELSRRSQELKKVGLKILGVDLRGSGRDLQAFLQNNGIVRVLEVQHGSRRDAAILPTD